MDSKEPLSGIMLLLPIVAEPVKLASNSAFEKRTQRWFLDLKREK